MLRFIIVEREPICCQLETVQAFASGMFGIAAEEMEHLATIGSDALWTGCSMLIEPRCSPRWWWRSVNVST
jgi:hypothetical protein